MDSTNTITVMELEYVTNLGEFSTECIKARAQINMKNTQVIANLSPDFFFDALLRFWKCWHCCHI